MSDDNNLLNDGTLPPPDGTLPPPDGSLPPPPDGTLPPPDGTLLPPPDGTLLPPPDGSLPPPPDGSLPPPPDGTLPPPPTGDGTLPPPLFPPFPTDGQEPKPPIDGQPPIFPPFPTDGQPPIFPPFPTDGQPPIFPPFPTDGQPGGNPPPPPPPGPVFRPIQPDLEQKFSGTGANAADTAAFIKDNMNNPNALYEFIQQKGLGFGLVAELFDGIREEDVAGFFGSHGLGPGQPPKPPVDGQPPLPPIDGQPGGNPPPPPAGPVFRPIQPDLEQKFSGAGAGAADTMAFIKAHLNDPKALFDFIQQKSLGFGLVAELFEGVRESDVEGFFAGAGLLPNPGSAGNPPPPPAPPSAAPEVKPVPVTASVYESDEASIIGVSMFDGASDMFIG